MTVSADEMCDEIIENVCIRYYENNQIVAIISDDSERDHIDAFVEFIKDHFYAQPEGKPLYFCFDISKSYYSIYGVRHFMELHQILGKNMQGAIAVVIKNDSIGMAMKLFADFNLARPVHKRQFFYDRESAIQWLQSNLPTS